jgi:hypothetical protein
MEPFMELSRFGPGWVAVVCEGSAGETKEATREEAFWRPEGRLAEFATSSYRRSTDKSPRRRVNAPGPGNGEQAPMQPQPNRVLHPPQLPCGDTKPDDSRGTEPRVQPLDSKVADIRDGVLRGAWWGAVGALDDTTDSELALVAGLDGIPGEAAQWLLEYRRRDTERRRRMQEALHGWRERGSGE